jgi:hypothetical protein
MSEEALTEVDRLALVNDIATRAGTASEIAKWYDMSRRDLEAFVEVHYPEIVAASNRAAARTPEAETAGTVTPRQLSELWISDKFERLLRYQELATSLREYRSYCTVVANELGQLMHRGAGEAGTGDTMSVDIGGVDLDSMK